MERAVKYELLVQITRLGVAPREHNRKRYKGKTDQGDDDDHFGRHDALHRLM